MKARNRNHYGELLQHILTLMEVLMTLKIHVGYKPGPEAWMVEWGETQETRGAHI